MTDLPDIQLTIPEVAEAAGTSAPKIRRWIAMRNKRVHASESFVVLGREGDKLSVGRGDDALLSPLTVLQVAIAARLADRGVSVFGALKAGMEFAHVGETTGGFVGEPQKEGRAPGQTFAAGETWLLVADDDCAVANVGGVEGDHNFKSLSDAIMSFQNRLPSEWCPLGYQNEAVVTMLMDGLPELICQRIDKVMRDIRPKNTRLSAAE